MATLTENGSQAPAEASAAAEGHGPHNNWGQEIHYEKVSPPDDFDAERSADDTARLGYLRDGRPWSPYGTFESGGIRKTPTKRPAKAAGAAGDGPRRRYAAGDKKPVEDVEGLYTDLDDCHAREVDLVKRIRERHPESRMGDPIHPRDLADGAYVRSEPMIGSTMAADMLIFITAAWAGAIGDPQAAPGPKAIDDAGVRVQRWSAHWGVGQDQKTNDAAMAIVALLFVFGPLIIASVKKLIGWLDERRRQQERREVPAHTGADI